MVDDHELAGLDPYEILAVEVQRIDRFYANAGDAELATPSRAAGWSKRDLLAHLAASEEYNRASLDGTIKEFLTDLGARGATDLATANELGVRQFDEMPTPELLDLWRARIAANHRDFAAHDGGMVDTSVGDYPARWQAFHLAFELAVHADDIGAPVSADEAEDRVDWQAHVARFALQEGKPALDAEAIDGRTRVRGDGLDIELSDDVFVQAVAARLPADSPLDERVAAALSVTP